MAKNNGKIMLGYDDEQITEKYKDQLNFTVNKIGGVPDFPHNIKLDAPKCPLCQLPRPLIVQIYAPLENSTYHRTLYLFACINANCWNSNESWCCVRVQTEEKIMETEDGTIAVSKSSVTDWCAEANDWDDDNNANIGEENGNIINERVSDEDEESASFEDSLRSGFGNLTVDERNANNGEQGGAVGRLHSPMATAEIEGNEGEVISIDSPIVPQNDIVALLQEATPLPQDLCHESNRNAALYFIPYFLSVYEEIPAKDSSNISDRHVKDLLADYQRKCDEVSHSPSLEGGGASGGPEVAEGYEKSNPAHGDKMFHHFLSRIQSNPGQILRYGREVEGPLLLYPLQEGPKTCRYCEGELVFELQLVPTLISKLKLITDKKHCTRLEFGTVLVYTCKKSCWSSENMPRLESVVVQSEIY